MLARSISLAFGLLIGAGASQLPEYAQQYRQRLGGAVDELKVIVANFDADSRKAAMTREAALAHLRDSPDNLVRDRGFQMQETMARADRLLKQQADLAHAGPFARIGIMLRDFDPAVARGALAGFEPGLPITSEGLGAGFLGLIGGGALFHALGTPFRRRVRVAGAPARKV